VQLEGLCSFDSQRVDTVYTPIPGDPCQAFPDPPFALAARHARWSPDGTMLAVHGAPEYWGVWDTRTGRLIRPALGVVALGQGVRTFDVSFTPDSRHLIVAVLDDAPVGELQRISTSTWQIERRREFEPSEFRLGMIGYSADGSTLVAVSEYQRGGEAIHWIDTETLEAVRAPRERIHLGVVFAAALNPGRDLLATGSRDGSLRVWDVATGEVDHELSFAGRSVDGVAFIDDRHIAVLLADEGNLLVLTLDESELVAIARSSLTRGFTGDECQRFNFDVCPTLEELRSG
jgi:WD40 repeat protein